MDQGLRSIFLSQLLFLAPGSVQVWWTREPSAMGSERSLLIPDGFAATAGAAMWIPSGPSPPLPLTPFPSSFFSPSICRITAQRRPHSWCRRGGGGGRRGRGERGSACPDVGLAGAFLLSSALGPGSPFLWSPAALPAALLLSFFSGILRIETKSPP